ncbi:hypothetical protein E9677_19215 [Rhizobium rhizophilum]|uniref:Uncharacterized protein n=1 Tax=Rhizobium rhizophilum TaxID=1850373 RepID=A0ABY2QPD7_9HYPH|nr:hypothetical protein E9677_19215 [Rhizobium rhizophilum]
MVVLPLTLPSPRRRGEGAQAVDVSAFSPLAGRRCRQADEGQRRLSSSPQRGEGGAQAPDEGAAQQNLVRQRITLHPNHGAISPCAARPPHLVLRTIFSPLGRSGSARLARRSSPRLRGRKRFR